MQTDRQHYRGLVAAFALALASAACSGGGTAATSLPDGADTTAPPASTTEAATTTVGGTAQPAATPLLIWAAEEQLPGFRGPAAEFEEATGVPVQVRPVSAEAAIDLLDRPARPGGSPDLFVAPHYWLGKLAAAGIAEPIDLGARAEEFLPVAVEAFTQQGSLYALPYALDAAILFRNTGLAPEAPLTLEDLTAACDTLSDPARGCLGVSGGADPYRLYAFLASTGGYVFGYDPAAGFDPTDLGLDDEGAIAGYTILAGLIADGYLDPATDAGATDRFLNGRLAFMVGGPGDLTRVRAAVATGSLPGYATSPLPALAGRVAVPFLTVEGVYLNAFGEQKALAIAFLLDYLATPEAMAALCATDSQAPAHLATFDAATADPDIQAIGRSAAAGQLVPSIPEMDLIWADWTEALAAVYGGAADPATALTTAARAIRAALTAG
jgi:arabinogalactan oligomer/maltooligosaccharide transport system substrate-binding protein